jgi:hypothetical protein
MKSTQFPADATHALTSAVGIRRYVNDEVARVAHRFNPDDSNKFEFLCECGRLACGDTVKMTLADYAESTPGSVVAHA